VIKRGFVRGERLLRAEEVAVFRTGPDGDENKE
jgi:hypothetical protein